VLILVNKKTAPRLRNNEGTDEKLAFWKPTAGGIYPILKDLEKLHAT